jgi:hypothetical protein
MSGRPRGSDEEILYLIKARRDAAWGAMRDIVEGFGLTPHTVPSVASLNTYCLNMVLCIELILKLLSNTWNSHSVGDMYLKAFGRPSPCEPLMEAIKEAVKDQKYVFEPAAGLADSLPDLEHLYDHLVWTLQQRYPKFFINKTVSLPPSFAIFVRDHAHRFTRHDAGTFSAANPPPQDFMTIQMAEAQKRLHAIRRTFAEHAAAGKPFDFQMMMSSVT